MPTRGASTNSSLNIGDPFPSIETVDLDGNPILISSDYFGEKATLIVFWSTWCGYCMRELPHEIEMANKYADAGLRVLGFNGDESPEIASKAVEALSIPWLNCYDGEDTTVSAQLGISSWPTLYLLDADGVVISSTPYLRAIGVEQNDQVLALDWTLKQVLATGAEED